MKRSVGKENVRRRRFEAKEARCDYPDACLTILAPLEALAAAVCVNDQVKLRIEIG